jgi:peptidoglycan hydrolase-like protein with peptidoglycan-binding domain
MTATTTAKELPVLQRGDLGNAVRVLQFLLNSKHFLFPESDYLVMDGVFGQKTEQAVRNFQRLFNLTGQGVVNPQTWHLLSLPEGH